MAAGIHTTKAPSTGMMASNAITSAHNIGEGRPSHQNIRPPSAPWTTATMRVPKTVARTVSVKRLMTSLVSASLSGEIEFEQTARRIPVTQHVEQQVEGQRAVDQLGNRSAQQQGAAGGQPGSDVGKHPGRVQPLLDPDDGLGDARVARCRLAPFGSAQQVLQMRGANPCLAAQLMGHKQARRDDDDAGDHHADKRREARPPQVTLDPPVHRQQQHTQDKSHGEGRQKRSSQQIAKVEPEYGGGENHQRTQLASVQPPFVRAHCITSRVRSPGTRCRQGRGPAAAAARASRPPLWPAAGCGQSAGRCETGSPMAGSLSPGGATYVDMN